MVEVVMFLPQTVIMMVAPSNRLFNIPVVFCALDVGSECLTLNGEGVGDGVGAVEVGGGAGIVTSILGTQVPH